VAAVSADVSVRVVAGYDATLDAQGPSWMDRARCLCGWSGFGVDVMVRLREHLNQCRLSSLLDRPVYSRRKRRDPLGSDECDCGACRG
jgi:hypothetical protein